MPECALPDHLKKKLHTDWIFPLNKISRGWNAFGPRCVKGNPGYLPWPPRLVKGKGISRWENDGATSIIEIPSLINRRVDADFVYGRKFLAIERNSGNPNFGQTGYVTINWLEGMNVPAQYHPSALQKFENEGDWGYIVLKPFYYACWKIIRKETEAKEGKVLFFRYGCRPDSKDVYYNKGPFAGLNWE